MVDVNVENRPVKLSLDNSQTEFVPDGEVWKVTLNIALDSTIGNNSVTEYVMVNENAVASLSTHSSLGVNNTSPVDVVLTGGDKITYSGDNGRAFISGFVVSE